MDLTKEQKVLQQVIAKAWEDASFKEALITNPIAAIKQLTGETVSIPSGKTLQVFDRSSPDVICLNIPQKPSFEDVELTDNELEAVAGGCCCPVDLLPDWINPTLPGDGPIIISLPDTGKPINRGGG